MFQPTHPHGVRLDGTYFDLLKDAFQPTHPHGVRRLQDQLSHLTFKVFQPTHPHGVRLVNRLTYIVGFRVSTHAPARGAT